jgi:hypothetical protein
MLDASCYPKLLLDALALAHLFIETMLPWVYAALTPLLDDLASDYAVDGHRCDSPLLSGGGQP